MRRVIPFLFISLWFLSCSDEEQQAEAVLSETAEKNYLTISIPTYQDQFEGFWLGLCIANWTGLVTEMDKIGDVGEFKTGPFYTREDWGKPDQPSIWGQGVPSDLSENIDFVFKDTNEVWGADDDTDIEYIYQELLLSHQTTMLTPEQIRAGWIKHIKKEEENFLWVSNQRALELMMEGVLPPETSNPRNNEEWEMIDAQLTTEIFGLYAPGHPDVALKMAHLPIRTTARGNAAWASEFYVVMYSLAAGANSKESLKEQTQRMAETARTYLPDTSYVAAMYDFVSTQYKAGVKWETVRDSLYVKYVLNEEDGYDISSQNKYCQGCFAGGINFGASIISLLYGEGNLKETIKIGALCGWDSDNPTATWGGMLGFMLGKKGVEEVFNRRFSNQFNIHRTRINFPNNGLDDFQNMSKKGLEITERVVLEEMHGSIDTESNTWRVPVY